MPRIFCDLDLTLHSDCLLTPEATRHIQVLRLQPGEEITLFNGRGGEFFAQIKSISRKEAWVHIFRYDLIERESPVRVHILMGMPANERMDWLIEKVTELGLIELTPLMTQHSVVRFELERGLKKVQHWQSIAFSACAQSGRNTSPIINSPTSLKDWLLLAKSPVQLESVACANPNLTALKYFFSLNAHAVPFVNHFDRIKASCTNAQRHVILAFGPEGGWSLEEESSLLREGFSPVHLGNRTLRAETAAIAALSFLCVGF